MPKSPLYRTWPVVQTPFQPELLSVPRGFILEGFHCIWTLFVMPVRVAWTCVMCNVVLCSSNLCYFYF